jgi:hypothetical protein
MNGGGYPVGSEFNSPKQKNPVIYPNPSSDHIFIETSSGSSECRAVILNIYGEQVFTCRITEPITTVDIGAFPPGVYFVRVTNGRELYAGKFIKR